VLQSPGGAFEHAYRLAQQLDAPPAAFGEAGRAQGCAERLRAVVALGERDLLGGECAGFGWCAEREAGKGRRRSATTQPRSSGCAGGRP